METYETMPRGDSAVCGRRVSFWMSRKKPMAQATFSWPFGPIHLERHQGAAQDERSALIFAAPGPHYGGRPPERLCRVSGAQNLSDLPQFNPGPLGPCVCKNFRFCHSTTAPEFAEPTAPVRRRPRRNHQSPKFPFQGPLHRENAPNQGKRLNGYHHNTDHADGLDATPERQRRRQQGG